MNTRALIYTLGVLMGLSGYIGAWVLWLAWQDRRDTRARELELIREVETYLQEVGR